MPILGIVASSITGNLVKGAFTSIATVTAAGGETSLSFSSIASTYTDLQIRLISKDTYSASATASPLKLRFNSDSASNYAYHYMYGDATNTGASGLTSTTSITGAGLSALASGTGQVAQNFGPVIIDITDYASTSKFKTIKTISGPNWNNAGTPGFVSQSTGIWLSTAAISSIQILAGNTSFVAGTTLALYGIKAAL
jgi:hypothetical protein